MPIPSTPPALAHPQSLASPAHATQVPVALTIAGFDPSSGAGITADLKTFAALSVYGVACITALTIQSTQGVRAIMPVDARLVRDTLACLQADVPFAGIKIGMLATGTVAAEVSRFLASCSTPRSHVVLDPVLRATSGKALLDAPGVDLIRNRLLAQVGFITPNLDELALLAGLAPTLEREHVPAAARAVRQRAAELGNPGLRIVVTGGHLEAPDDFLLSGDEESWLAGERVNTQATHGTGCAFASALTAQLIAGLPATDAVVSAKAYVAAALKSAYPVGQGHGPMHHLFRLDATPEPPRR